jgi:hypothetical protein
VPDQLLRDPRAGIHGDHEQHEEDDARHRDAVSPEAPPDLLPVAARPDLDLPGRRGEVGCGEVPVADLAAEALVGCLAGGRHVSRWRIAQWCAE